MNIIIGADLVPTKTNIHFFENGDMKTIIAPDLFRLLQTADYRIFNLETPLCDTKTPIAKFGPNLIASAKSISGYKALGIDFLTLANNHIMDHGEQGLKRTIEILEEAEINYAGVGENKLIAQHKASHTVYIEDVKIGIYCCAEHEFSIATPQHMGANPFDPLDSLDHIETLKKQNDYVICLYHGGKEHYRYPSPNLQKVCRRIVDKGADLVICQHSHCIGSQEDYKDAKIIYGQGNFLFDIDQNPFWQTSLLIQIDPKTRIVSYIPLCKQENGVRLATQTEAAKIMGDFNQRSQQIQQNGFVESTYASFAKDMLHNYLLSSSFMANSLPFRILNKLSGGWLRTYFAQRKLNKYASRLINFLECEAHRELILSGLKEHFKRETERSVDNLFYLH